MDDEYQSVDRVERYRTEVAEKVATKVYGWLSEQTYQGEAILHAVVCCDFVSAERFKEALKGQVLLALKEGVKIDEVW